MGDRNPYYNIRDEDEEREQQFRKDRKERVQQKRWVGSGEDGDFYASLNEFNKVDHAR